MLLKLGQEIADALDAAVAAEERARETTDPQLRLDNERMAESWRLFARSLQFVESLERFPTPERFEAAHASEETSLGMTGLCAAVLSEFVHYSLRSRRSA
jgi:hypothetical protein